MMMMMIFCGCTAWFVSNLVGNPKDRFSHDAVHLSVHVFIIHSRYKGHTSDIDKALGSCDPSQPVILIAHRPETAKLALDSKHRVDLVLSGKLWEY